MAELKSNPKICAQCILPDSFPGINFDDLGICNHCRKEQSTTEIRPEKKLEYRQRLEKLINETKGKAPVYDVVMAYSGGKDSSYALKLLRENYDLRIAALTFDNHFVSPTAWENIKTMTDALGIDLISFRTTWPATRKIFKLTAEEDVFPMSTLLRASAICTACIGIVKSIALRTSLEMSIPLVAFGWSPGQAPIQSAIMKTNPSLIKRNQAAFAKVFPDGIRKDISRYLIPENYYDDYRGRFPHNIHPLAYFDYDEDEIVKAISKLGWKNPRDTDTNSSNCLLNAYGNHCHLERYGFHPYAWEIANMVRRNVVSREEGIRKIYTDQDQNMINFAREKLNG